MRERILLPRESPVICSPADGAGEAPGYDQGVCSKCGVAVLVNCRVADIMTRAGIDSRLICISCWSSGDQRLVAAYRRT